jgi:Ca2+-binding EF-hand superfamily protein
MWKERKVNQRKANNFVKCFDKQAAFEKLFDEIDTDNSGTLTFREIMVFCKKRGIRLGFGEIVAFMKYYDMVREILCNSLVLKLL